MKASLEAEIFRLLEHGRSIDRVRIQPCPPRSHLILGTEWQLVDLALAAYNKVGVALYSTLGRNAVGTSKVEIVMAQLTSDH